MSDNYCHKPVGAVGISPLCFPTRSAIVSLTLAGESQLSSTGLSLVPPSSTGVFMLLPYLGSNFGDLVAKSKSNCTLMIYHHPRNLPILSRAKCSSNFICFCGRTDRQTDRQTNKQTESKTNNKGSPSRGDMDINSANTSAGDGVLYLRSDRRTRDRITKLQAAFLQEEGVKGK